MKQCKFKKLLIVSLFIFSSFLMVNFSFAATDSTTTKETPLGRLQGVQSTSGYKPVTDGSTAVATYVGQVISYMLAMLGVVFLVLLIYAGFNWMTARGDSNMVEQAKDTMRNAIIGIIITMLSYGISVYVVGKIAGTTTTGTGGTPPAQQQQPVADPEIISI